MEHSTDLTAFFEPRNLAIIGSFREGLFGGYLAVQSLKRAGFRSGRHFRMCGQVCPRDHRSLGWICGER